MLPEGQAGRRWWLLHVAAPVLVLGLSAMWLGSLAADVALVEPFFSATRNEFPLRNQPFFSHGLHLGGKFLVIVGASVLLCFSIVGMIRGKPRAWWGRLAYPVVCLGLSAGIAAIWKDLAHQGVPPQLAQFGGSRAGLDEGTPVLFGLHLGSPAAHAAGGFAWVSLYFVALSMSVARPLLWLAPGIVLGVVFALTQHVRGAHVPSHNLWSVAIAWGVAALTAAAFRRFGLLPWNEPGTVSAPTRSIELEDPGSTAEPWLVGLCGFLCGTGFFALDLMLDQSEGGVHEDFGSFEFVEWIVMGPGIGVTMFLFSDRLRILRERTARRAIAEREDRFRLLGRMAASVAHEVRNPLHTLRLIVDEQKLEVPGLAQHPLQPEMESCMDRINRAVDLVYRLARPGAGEEGRADLVPAVRASLEELERTMPARPEYTLERWPESAHVNATDSGARIVVENLLRNAFEAAGPGKRITLDLARADGAWILQIVNPGHLAVSRDGTGLADSEKADGLGLGLAISRQIVAGTGGTIDLREDEGGVRCTMRWPAAEARSP
jgi:membrane-associated PAP2 superfamily phosphatase/two-component sensor histidine kinase